MTAVTGAGPRLRTRPAGATGAHVQGLHVPVATVVAIALIAGVGALITAIVRSTHKPPCPAVVTCLSPGHAAGPNLTKTYPNNDLHWSFQYPSDAEKVTAHNSDAVDLHYETKDADNLVSLRVVPASQQTPDGAFQARYQQLAGQNFNFDPADTTSINRIVKPEIGFVPGEGNSYSGTFGTSSTQKQAVDVAIMSATDGRLTVMLSIIVVSNDLGVVNNVRSLAADLILDTFSWRT